MIFRLFPSGQNAYADNAFIQLVGTPQDIYTFLFLGNNSTLCGNLYSQSGFLAAVKNGYNEFVNHGNDNDYVPNGWSRSVRPVCGIRFQNASEISSYEALFNGKSITFLYHPSLTGSGFADIATYSCVFPSSSGKTANVTYLIDNPCGFNSSAFTGNDILAVDCLDFELSSYVDCSGGGCQDSRSSGAQQMIDITLEGEFMSGNPVIFNYSLGFQTPTLDNIHYVTVPSGSIRQFTKLNNVSAEFSGGVIRDSGYIKLYGTIVGTGVGIAGGSIDINNYDNEVEICTIGFSPCEDVSDSFIMSYNNNLESLIDVDEYTAYVYISKIEWYGFKMLNNYCCDNSVVVPIDEEEFPPNSTIGGSGGGGDVDITCICDNLALINTTLSNKLDSVSTKLDLINDTIEDKSIDLTLDSCVCDNLEAIADNVSSISDSIDNISIPSVDVSSIASAITNKQIPVTDVTGVSLAIAQKQIPVTDVSGVVTGLGNIDSSLGQIDNDIAGGTADISSSIDDCSLGLGSIDTTLGSMQVSVDTSALVCTDDEGNEEGLACILKNALNNRDDKGLADVIEDKDCSSFVDVAVEPYDLVNIRKAFSDNDIIEG